MFSRSSLYPEFHSFTWRSWTVKIYFGNKNAKVNSNGFISFKFKDRESHIQCFTSPFICDDTEMVNKIAWSLFGDFLKNKTEQIATELDAYEQRNLSF